MSKKLSKDDRMYIEDMNRWASNEEDTIATFENDNLLTKRILNRNKSIILSHREKLQESLKDYNTWRKSKGLKPVKKFKYVRV